MKKLAALLILVSTACFATENQIDFTLGRGSPQSAARAGNLFQEDGSQGLNWSADFLHKIARQVSIGIGGGHFSSGDNTETTFVPNTSSTVSSKMTSILALGRLDLTSSAKFVPYVIAGIGWARNSLTVSALPDSTWSDTGTSESRTLVDDSGSALGYAAGAGVDVALSDRIFLGVEARYQGSTRRSFDVTPQGESVMDQGSVSTALKMVILGIKAAVRY